MTERNAAEWKRLADEAHRNIRWIILHAPMDDVDRWHNALYRAARRRERREQAMYRAMMTENDA